VDLAVFGPQRVRDVATYAEPHAFSAGIEHVYVNGVAALAGGKITGATPGRVLRFERRPPPGKGEDDTGI
jgi:N-acyl-D-amino-acid deacylase